MEWARARGALAVDNLNCVTDKTESGVGLVLESWRETGSRFGGVGDDSREH